MRKKPSVKVYIDGANIFYIQKKLLWFRNNSRLALSWKLRLAASNFYYLEDIKKEIFRKNCILAKPVSYDIEKLLNRGSR